MSSHVKEAREQLERAHVLATEIQKQLGFTPASSPACAGGIERSVMEPAKAKSGAEEAQPRTAADPAPVPTEGAPSADDCPLFHEWRQLAGVSLDRAAAEPGAAPIGKGDALVIIDMQKDFVPSSVYNPDGGRFGVDEGDEIVAEICSMIRAASEAGATIIASRDYHPHDHCSFVHKGGHFPPHCVQGTEGSKFLPEIAQALELAMRNNGPERTFVAFKAMHEEVDSFGALPYGERSEFPFGKDRLATKRAQGTELDAQDDFVRFGAVLGCAQAPWTGSLILKQSGMMRVADDDHDGKDEIEDLDLNAPPDVLAILSDGVDRQRRTMQDVLLKNLCPETGRVFVCGLAMDFCVRDTCINAKALNISRVALVLDASRAAHIPGVGSYGSGFLSDPKHVVASLKDRGVELLKTSDVLGAKADHSAVHHKVLRGNPFPAALGPLSVNPVPRLGIDMHLSDANAICGGRYTLHLDGPLRPLTLLENFDNTGVVSPLVPIPADWPRVDKTKPATQLCWASPVAGARGANFATVANKFMAITRKPALNFALFGGALLLDTAGDVVEVQTIRGTRLGGLALSFLPPVEWKKGFKLETHEEADRVQHVRIAAIRAKGADRFCWLGPNEKLSSGNETWTPSTTGGFVYFDSEKPEKPPIFFPLSPDQEG
eukprot:Tamp_04557.p1 GENE.Tamp_04557~~Tamp_04557.p1  ORF type:complete len:667 (+),score=102.32 Tamp_04557:23-2002(+)